MKKFILKFTSVVLILTLFLSPLSVAAAEPLGDSTQNCPYIFVHGFMAVDLYENLGTENQRVIWPPSKYDLTEAAKNSIIPIGEYFIDRDWDKLSDSIIPNFKSIFEKVFLDENGNPQENTGVDFVYPNEGDITATSKLDFKYDWRLDPIEIAGKLNDFIDYVLEASGCSKVTIIAHSCGGVIVTTYARLYGTQKLQGVVLNSTAVLGETYTGELMSGNFNVNAEALKSYFEFVGFGSEYKNLIDTVLNTMMKRGLLVRLSRLFNTIFDNMLDEIAKELIMPMFGSWATIWAMTPDEYLPGANSYIFGKISQATGKDYSGLKAKIDNYNEAVRPYRLDTVNAMGENCKFGVFARYGFISVPLSSTWDELSDGIIDLKYASFGGTAAKYNNTLSPEYLNSVAPEYISPNKTVDASTCLFPEKTWFIRNMKHGKSLFNLENLVFEILYNEEEVTVSTFAEYPRFLVMDYTFNRIVADSVHKISPLEALFPWAKRLFNTIAELFKFIKKIIFGIS